MQQYDLNTRYNHIKLHSKCLFRVSVELIDQKIDLPTYYRKSWFFASGIARALLPNLESPLNGAIHHVQLYTKYNQPSGSLMVSSSLTATQV